jgi:hypothetical protein
VFDEPFGVFPGSSNAVLCCVVVGGGRPSPFCPARQPKNKKQPPKKVLIIISKPARNTNKPKIEKTKIIKVAQLLK